MLIRFKRQLLWNKGQEKWVRPLKQSIESLPKVHQLDEEKNEEDERLKDTGNHSKHLE